MTIFRSEGCGLVAPQSPALSGAELQSGKLSCVKNVRGNVILVDIVDPLGVWVFTHRPCIYH